MSPRAQSSVRLRGLVVVLGWLAVAAGPWAERADAHAAFVRADPAPGLRVETAPQRVVLTFTEPLNVRLSRARLAGPGGAAVPLAAAAATQRRLVMRPRTELATGTYTVTWHTVSTEDGHALEGVFSFGVRAEAATLGQVIEQSPLARNGWLRILARTTLYVTLLLFAAGVLLAALLGHRGISWLAPAALGPVDAAAVARREKRLLADGGWLALGAAIAVTFAEAADAASGLSVSGLADYVVGSTAGLGRVVVVAALALAALLAPRRRAWSGLAVTVALGAVAASGHAASASPRTLSVLNDWAHLLSGALWLGGIGVMAIVLTPLVRSGGRRARRVLAAEVLPRFGLVALPAFAVVSMTGLLSLLLQVEGPQALLGTTYGRLLLVKVALVGAIAAASALHVLGLRPRMLRTEEPAAAERPHWRLVRAEPILAVAVAATVAALATFPLPPRQLNDAEAALGPAGGTCTPCPLPAPAADELAVAAQAGPHVVAAWLRRDAGRVTGTVRVLDRQGRPADADPSVRAARSRSCGRGCLELSAPASRELTVDVRQGRSAFTASLPGLWRHDSAGRARRVLARAERTMRALRAVREVERISSGPGTSARASYTLVAPDRMRFITARGVELVTIGERQWSRIRQAPWIPGTYGSGIPFSVRRWFRWSTYAASAQVLDRRRFRGRAVTELALMDPATPVWFRLLVEDRTGRVLREQMTARAHFMQTRYERFDDDRLEVRSPDDR